MRRLPLASVERIFCLPSVQGPRLLAHTLHESPSAEELRPNLLIIEIRGGYLKWAHWLCPKCGDHIQLTLACAEPVFSRFARTLAPSIWEIESCGAHFFIRKGKLVLCQ